MKNFLIGQLACYGDCLYATTVAKQIKHDFPDSHITWAVASKYRSILDLNPYIDEIWEIPVKDNDFYGKGWLEFVSEAKRKKKIGLFDELVFTQIPSHNWKKFNGTIRSSIIGSYKRPITLSVQPVVRLSKAEVLRVKRFADDHQLEKYANVVLFECTPGSGQSSINIDFALKVAGEITNKFPNVCFILSTHVNIENTGSRIFVCSTLSFRENAELTKYCTHLIGCSSGITWLATSDWSKRLKMVQLLDRDAIYAGLKYDHEIWKLPTEEIIEITKIETGHVVNCVSAIFEKDFNYAKSKFDEFYRLGYGNFSSVVRYLINRYKGNQVPPMLLEHYRKNRYLNPVILTWISLKILFDVYRIKSNNYRAKLRKRVRN